MLTVENICNKAGTFELRNISFQTEEADYFVLLGASGSGKSMLLEIIAGLNPCDQGKIFLNKIDITHIPLRDRQIGLVFQDLCLFPHKTVYKNISYALQCRKINKAEIDLRVRELASSMEILHLLFRHTRTLSGGESQRVALARALASRPKCLLLDEPLSSLDARLKQEMRSLLRRINSMGITIVHVTHDFDEALSLARHVAVMDNGKIVQQGTPNEVLSRPETPFVAHFTGIRNFFSGNLLQSNNPGHSCIFETRQIRIFVQSDSYTGDGHVIIPSENITLSHEKIVTSAVNIFEGIVKDIEPVSFGIQIFLDGELPLWALISRESYENLSVGIDKKFWVSFKASAVTFIKS